MKIAYLSPRFLTSPGGAEQHVQRLVEELAKRGHELTVIAADAGAGRELRRADGYSVQTVRTSPRFERAVQVFLRLQRRRFLYRPVRWLDRNGYVSLLGGGPYSPDIASPALYRGYDVVVNFHGFTPWSILFARAARQLRGQVTVAVALFHVREETAQWDALRSLHAACTATITNTAYESDFLAARGWDAGRLFAVGVGSDPWPGTTDPAAFRSRHGIPADAPLILFLGRKIFNKGVPHLVQAMRGVWDRFPRAHLALLGFSHNPPAWIQGYLNELDPARRGQVLNLDDVSAQEREDGLAACDVFAMPSISDSFGIAYLDAWRHRKPVIACSHTCAESFIRHGENGLLVAFGDTAALAGAVNELLGSSSLRERMGKAGYSTWESNYQWSMIAEKTEALFIRLKEHLL